MSHIVLNNIRKYLLIFETLIIRHFIMYIYEINIVVQHKFISYVVTYIKYKKIIKRFYGN